MVRITVLLLILVTALSAETRAGGEASATPAEDPRALHFELLPERAPTAEEALWLKVRIGALPAKSTLVVRDEAGEEIGAISPYGKPVREKGGSHLLPLPDRLQSGELLKLRFELALPHHVVRRPTPEELPEPQVVYVPVVTQEPGSSHSQQN